MKTPRILWTLVTSAIRFWYWLRPLLPWRRGRIAIAWDANDQAEAVLGYVVQWGTSPGVYKKSRDVGNRPQCTILGLWPGRTYYIAVRAYNAWQPVVGLSLPSSEVSGTATRRPMTVAAAVICSLLLLSPTALRAQTAALGPYLSQASCTNTTTAPGACTFSIWNYGDGWNQTELVSFTGDAQPGETVPLSMRLDTDTCTPTVLQLDVWWNLPNPRQRHTISDTLNAQLLASKVVTVPATKTCPPPPLPPIVPPPPVCVSPGSFSFGGSPTIARFPTGYPNPWFPEMIGPFYWLVPPGTYHITMWTGDDHVDQPTRGIVGKYDGPQDERGTLVFDSGDILGPTNDVPDDQNKAFTDFGTRALSGFTRFWFVHAAPANPPEPTGSFYPIALTITCVEGGQ